MFQTKVKWDAWQRAKERVLDLQEACSQTTAKYNKIGGFGGGGGDSKDSALAALADATSEAEAAEEAYLMSSLHTAAMIRMVLDDERKSQMMIQRYCQFRRWSDIQKELGVPMRTLYQWHKDAKKEIQEYECN